MAVVIDLAIQADKTIHTVCYIRVEYIVKVFIALTFSI